MQKMRKILIINNIMKIGQMIKLLEVGPFMIKVLKKDYKGQFWICTYFTLL
jgi:hypothetical protein